MDDVDKKVIIEKFIRSFVIKQRRPRARLELSSRKRRLHFADKLNHDWDRVLDIRKLKCLPKVDDDYAYLLQKLRFKENGLCYLISHYDDLDDRFLDFKTAFNSCYTRGFATLVINTSGDRFYLETEGIGHKYTFTGEIK
ncbi:hypothetical protein [Chondrinema litorale]|uniref:hypothetical protein n=1 Tax=Chondrinema litorale TaxID=2994555 RepID=UPI0025430703|nr:hypothetical protein [Chondrinema litorale]UZR95685.1 hypothetical protein OQ292_07660 [Chondrinema litorale]